MGIERGEASPTSRERPSQAIAWIAFSCLVLAVTACMTALVLAAAGWRGASVTSFATASLVLSTANWMLRCLQAGAFARSGPGAGFLALAFGLPVILAGSAAFAAFETVPGIVGTALMAVVVGLL